jgi:hypothetical protein
MQGKTRFILTTMCIYDRWMLGNTWSSSGLTSRSLCGTYSRYSSLVILLKGSPYCGSTTLDLVISFASPKARGWMKTFFIVVLMIVSGLVMYSNCLVVLGEETSHVSSYFIFGALGECLVVGFLDGIVPTT